MITAVSRALPVYLGECTSCDRPVRVTDEQASTNEHTVPCPACEAPVKAQRLYAVTTGEECHLRCLTATGPNCECGCSGWHHGAAWQNADAEALADEVDAWRERQARIETRKARAHVTKVKAFEAWAEEAGASNVVGWLLSEDRPRSTFLDSLTDQVEQFRALTPRQVDGVSRWMDAAARRAARRAQLEADAEARKAARVAAGLSAVEPLPVGKGVQVTGVIARTSILDGKRGARYRMQVAGEGWTLWTTLPAALHPSTGRLAELHGQRVAFVADVEPAHTDPTQGRALRPRKAALIPA